MIDTHSHVATNIEGLDYVILSASNLADSGNNLVLAKNNDKLKTAVGIHPLEKITNYKMQITNLDDLITKNTVAIGECGLDFSQEYNLKNQSELFEGQIELSIKHNLPLIIHAREAVDEVIEVLEKYPQARGVFHCYTGGKKRVKKVLELGDWYFGVDGNITYEAGLEEVVKIIPRDRLVAETDSPELTPLPYRGQRNQPNYVEFVYRKIAEIWGMSFEETEKIVDGNARILFAI